MSTPTSTTTTVTDPSAISGYNRGPLTTVFAPPTSCLATLTLPTGSNRALFFGHNAYSYIDESCYPLGTLSSQNLVLAASWDVYYCKKYIVPLNLSVFHVNVRIDSPGLCPSGWTAATLMTSLYHLVRAPLRQYAVPSMFAHSFANWRWFTREQWIRIPYFGLRASMHLQRNSKPGIGIYLSDQYWRKWLESWECVDYNVCDGFIGVW